MRTPIFGFPKIVVSRHGISFQWWHGWWEGGWDSWPVAYCGLWWGRA